MRRLSLKKVLLSVWSPLTESNEIYASLCADLIPTGMKRGKLSIGGSLVIRRDAAGKGTLVAINTWEKDKEAIQRLAQTSKSVDLMEILDNLPDLQESVRRVIENQDKARGPGATYSNQKLLK